MKKLTDDQKEWNLRKQLRLARGLTRTRRRKRKTKHKATVSEKRTVVLSPYVLSIYEKKYYNKTISFIKDIARNVVKENQKVLIDLSRTQDITVAAMLCIFAEITRCIILKNENSWIRIKRPRHVLLRDRLMDSGFFNSVNVLASNPISGKSQERGMIPLTTGVHADGRLDGLMDAIGKALYGGHIPEETGQTLYRSLSEAMLNVWQHAYPEDAKVSDDVALLGKRWWFFGQRFNDQLYIAIYDRGVGIPETLPNKYPIEIITDFLSKLHIAKVTDANMIHAAMELGRSRTDRPERGKGLQDVRRFVDFNPSGTLRIFSNRGDYTYAHSGTTNYIVHDESIKGTLIQWNVRLPS